MLNKDIFIKKYQYFYDLISQTIDYQIFKNIKISKK